MIVEKNVYEGYKELLSLVNRGEFTIYQGKEYFRAYMQSQSFRIIGLRPEFPKIEYSYSCLMLYENERLICGFPYKFSKKKVF